MKLTKGKIILSVIAVSIIWLAVYSIQPLWWSFMDFTNPKYYEETYKILKSKNPSNKYLLSLFNGRSAVHSAAAANILSERKDAGIISTLMKIAKSSNEHSDKSVALLCNFYDRKEVKDFLFDIVRKGKENPRYLNTVMVLAQEHNEEIYPEILKMAKDNFHTSWVVDMLEYYPEKPETIETLTKIASSDPERYIRDKAKDALKKLRVKK